MTSPAAAANPDAEPRRPTRRRRRLLLILVFFLVVAVMAPWVATRPATMRSAAEWWLERRFRGGAEVGSVVHLGHGRFRLRDIHLRAPGWKGDAGDAVAVGVLELTLDLSRIWRGSVGVTAIDVASARVRIAERESSPGSFNLETLIRPDRDDVDDLDALPRLTVGSLTVEMGSVDDAGRWTLSGSTVLRGQMVPAADASAWIVVDLREDSTDGLALEGRFDPTTLEHELRMGPMELTPRLRSLCPITVRSVWDLMDPAGRIEGAVASWARGGEPYAEASIAGARITMPVAVEGQWVRLRGGQIEPTSGRPRLNVGQGRLRLDGDSLLLDRLRGDLIGTDTDTPLVGVPFTLQFRASQLPRFADGVGEAWVAEALGTAPFELELQLPDFAVDSEDPAHEDVIELPFAVADVLEGLGLRRWTISSVLTMRRELPTSDAAGRPVAGAVSWSGRAVVSGATMSYERFEYTLLDTSAFLSFDRERVVVRHLKGRGVSGGSVTVTGEITQPGPDAGYALRIVGTDIPLDDSLITALPSDAATTVRFLIDESAWARLDEAGVAPSAARATAWRAERNSLAVGTAVDALDPETRRRVAALDRAIELGTWSPGGAVDIDFTATRPVGSKKMAIAGRIDLAGVVGVCRAFPYPFRVAQGAIELSPGGVSLLDGLRVDTVGGGSGRIEGRIELPDDGTGRRIQPALRIVVADDEITPALLEAIPTPGTRAVSRDDSGAPRDDGAPEVADGDDDDDAARWLREAQVEGRLDAHASIGTDPSAVIGEHPRITWNVVATLSEGRAVPARAIGRLLRSSALDQHAAIPHATGLEARVDIDPQSVKVSDLRGAFDGAPLHASIEIDLAAPRETRIRVDCTDQPLDRWMIGLAPSARRERLEALWDRLRPTGRVDIDVAGRLRPGGEHSLSMELEPRAIEVRVEKQPVDIDGRGGRIRADAAGVAFDDLLLGLHCEGSDQGELRISTIRQPESTDRLALRWRDGSLDSPLLAEALRQLGHGDLVAEAERFRPRGRFDLDLETACGDPPPLAALDLVLHPRNVMLEIGATPVNFSFEDGALVTLDDERVTLKSFAGRFGRGSFHLEGGAWLGGSSSRAVDQTGDQTGGQTGGQAGGHRAGESTGDDAGGELLLDFVGEGLPDEVRAILPAGIVATMDGIDLTLEGRTAARGRLLLREDPVQRAIADRSPTGTARAPLLGRDWIASFDGTVEVARAAFHAGVDVSELRGSVALRAEGGTQMPPVVEIEPSLDEVVVLGRRLEDARGRVIVDRGASEVRLQSIRARMEDGVLEARGVVGTEPDAPYSISIEGAGIPLAALATRAPASPVGADEATPSAPGGAEAGSPAMGRVVGRLDLDGTRGSPTSRRGRGAVEIREARMGSMPLTLGLLQLSQLMLPLNDALSRADATFYVVGETLTFERLDLTSDTLRLRGEGELDLPTLTISARFSAGGPLPFVSDLMRSLSDQLYAIELKGPLMSPRAGLVPLPTLGTLLPRSSRVEGPPPAGAADAPPPLVPRHDAERAR